jgi:hydrogenase-4 component B
MKIELLMYIMVFMPMAGALLSYIIGRKTKAGRDIFVRVLTIAEFLFAVLLMINAEQADGVLAVVPGVCGMGLQFTVDGFRGIYAAIAVFMWMMTSIFSIEYFAHYRNRNRYYLFQLVTLGATVAVFLSADLFTTFIFFEIMSMASYVWVAQDERKASLRAGATYLAVAVIGGLVMLMGIFMLYYQAGTLQISELQVACQGKNVYVAAICLFVGFGAKAGAFPLHIWLPKAHPVAPAPASALLSGILTKTGMYGILIVSCNIFLHDVKWSGFVLGIGVLTMFGGAMLAVFSVDLKRTLACSSMSQIGFILVGTGMMGFLGEHGQLAVHGTFLHMVNHSLIKLVLFMAAGVIYMNTHALNLNDIRGFGRKKPLLKVAFLIGALAIGGIPGFSGYISKTLIHESIIEYGAVGIFRLVEYIFLLSGGLTVAYMTKIFKAVFIEKNENEEVQKKFDAKKKYMNPVSSIALAASAIVLFVWGIFPHQLMDKAAELAQGFMNFHPHGEGHAVHYFIMVNLKGAIISIVIGALVYVFVISYSVNKY